MHRHSKAKKVIDKEKDDNARELITLGGDVAGGTVGVLLGLMAAGPIGAVIGGISGPVLSHVICKISSEMRNRYLAKREESRIGATLAFSLEKILENQKQGKKIRDDGFFDETINDRSTADEVFEGVLIAAQREHEERKLKYFGNLIANIAYDKNISRSYANILIKMAEKLSYRQLCLLFVFSGVFKDILRKDSYRNYSGLSQELIGILQEAYDLYLNSLINNGGSAMLGLSDLEPGKARIQGIGTILICLMELHRIDMQDIGPLIEALK